MELIHKSQVPQKLALLMDQRKGKIMPLKLTKPRVVLEHRNESWRAGTAVTLIVARGDLMVRRIDPRVSINRDRK